MSASPTLPHSRCNWLTETVLLGAVPIPETLPALLAAGLTRFICLSSVADCWYRAQLPAGCTLLHYPIPSGGVPTAKVAHSLISHLSETPEQKTYIHCSGGHGRTGVIGALLYGSLNLVLGAEAIRAVEASRETRLDKSRNFIPTPETQKQVNFVGKVLGIDPFDPMPDRSDRSWLKRLRSERAGRGRARR